MLETWIYSLCLATLGALLLYLFRKWSNTQNVNLPGPGGLPFFGCIHKINKTRMHLTLNTWAKEFGDIYKITFLGKTLLVVNTSTLARELFLQEPMATITSGRMPTFASKYIMEDSDLILENYSEEMKYRRKIAHQVLRVYGEGLRQIEDQLLISLKRILRALGETKQTIVDPARYVDDFLLENLEVLIVGHRGNRELQNSMKEMDECFNHHMSPGIQRILTRFPYLRHIPRYANVIQKMKKNRDNIMKLLSDISEQHPESCGIYQNLLKIVEGDKPKDKKKITMKNVVMILHDLISAGYMTTRGSLMATVKILISKPDVQQRIQEEIDRVVGHDRLPYLADRELCPYTEATILEVLRYISHTPLTGHRCMDEIEFHGVRFPKDCVIFVNTWHIHHSEKEWDKPMNFMPERFLDDDGKLVEATHPNRKRLATFSYGKRSCIGEVFAKSRIFLFLASLMQQYSVCPPENESVPLFDPADMEPGIVLLPTAYKCRFVPRKQEPPKKY